MKWIKTSDRLPTEADVDKFGEILVYSLLYGAEQASPEDLPGNEKHWTHWAKIEPPTND